MGDERLQTRRKTFDLRCPVRQQRSRGYQQAWLLLAGRLALEHEQQRKHLNGLAQPHVIGQAGPETEFRDEIEPAHSHLLVGPQRRVQGRAGVDSGQSLRAAETFQRLGEPGAGDHLRPLGVGIRGGIAGCDIGAGEQTNGLPKAEPILRCRALDLTEVLQHAAQPLTVHLDPTAADQRQPIGFRQ